MRIRYSALLLSRCVVLMGVVFFAMGCSSSAPMATHTGATDTGIASYYADKFEGRTTANGETYRGSQYTAAHRTLPFGSRVRVTRLDTGAQVTVRINDRGPFVDGRIIDLSRRAARDINMVRDGLAEVRIELVNGDASASDTAAPPERDSNATSW